MYFKKSHVPYILQVLTFHSSVGEYGGPVRVARELASAFTNKTIKMKILTGVDRNVFSTEDVTEASQYFIKVPIRSYWPRYRFSSMFSFAYLRTLLREIRVANLVHIHFARELIPVLAAVIAILFKKPYVIQTHGMISTRTSTLTRFFDILITKPIRRKAKIHFCLNAQEADQMRKSVNYSRIEILPNGLRWSPETASYRKHKFKNITFCSRLHIRKHPERFLAVAREIQQNNPTIRFNIYGPDGGELNKTLSAIKWMNLKNTTYWGPLNFEDVLPMLSKTDLLILPSENEPFPMIVLEALSVGTPCLILSNSGIAFELQKLHNLFVADDQNDLITKFKDIAIKEVDIPTRREICNFFNDTFEIQNSMLIYIKAISRLLDE